MLLHVTGYRLKAKHICIETRDDRFPGLSKDIVSNSDLVWVVLAGDKHVRLYQLIGCRV